MDQRKTSFQPVAYSLTVLAALLRLAPHPPNFTPVGGLALFGGARLNGWQAYVVPILVMLVTDPVRSLMEGHYPAYSFTTLVVYCCFLINVVLGRALLRNSSSAWRIAAVAALGSIQFYLLTNLPSWWSDPTYGHTAAGLLACYIAALPFFARTLLGDLFFSGLLFSAYALLSRRLTAQHQPA
jgi:hypothetical protein